MMQATARQWEASRRILATVLAIDPGPVQSAWLFFEEGRPDVFGIWPNEQIADEFLRGSGGDDTVVVIEHVESYGMAVGREVFDTVRWTGRFEEAAGPSPVVLMPRRTVKLHLCGSSRAKDANVRQALLDRFGGNTVAVGRKAAPGPLYGVSKDVWSALALAVTYADGVR
jgi:hypothetical protein